MHPIELREQHSNLMSEIGFLLAAAQNLTDAATGLGESCVREAKEKLIVASGNLTGIAMRLK